jgi:hypothetical protein
LFGQKLEAMRGGAKSADATPPAAARSKKR